MLSPDDRQDRWDRAARLLEQAVTLDPPQRESFLAQHEPDPELRAEVTGLLAYSDAGRFLEEPVPYQPVADPLLGIQAGNCRLTKLLGEGGMGSVYEAVRTLEVPGVELSSRPEQRVAVKICHPGQFDPESFRREAAALARLDDPGVARLYDVGRLNDGQLFLVMELVEGQPLHECAAAKTEPEKLSILAQVCQAVHAAHSAGLVHRDIKPSNILVNASGSAKLIDFGISKQADDPGRTLDARLTPRYASPEQFGGEPAAAAADVYSLGVVMYEVLTGGNPFAGKTGPELMKAVCEDAPPLPPLPKDLASIVLKAMAREPRDRYASATALAADIERYRRGEPVLAVEAGAGYRLKRYCSRRRVPLAAAAAALVLLAIGFGRAYWERRQTMHQFQQTHALARSLLFDVHDELIKIPGTLETRKANVTRALQYLDELASHRPADAALQVDLADSYFRAGMLQATRYSGAESMGKWEDAHAHYEKSMAILERVRVQNPGHRLARSRLARSYQALADACAARRDAACQDARARQSLALYEQDAREHPEDGRAQVFWLTARVKNYVAPRYRDRKLAEAREELLSVAAVYEQLSRRTPPPEKLGTNMAWAFRWLGNVEAVLGNHDSAISWMRKAQAINGGLNDRSAVAEVEENVAWVLGNQGKAAEAEAACGRAVEMRRRLAEGRGEDNASKRELAGALLRRASFLNQNERQGRQAHADASEALALLAPLAANPATRDAAVQIDLAQAFCSLGDAQWQLNEKQAARAAYRKFLDLTPSLSPTEGMDGWEAGVEQARKRLGGEK